MEYNSNIYGLNYDSVHSLRIYFVSTKFNGICITQINWLPFAVIISSFIVYLVECNIYIYKINYDSVN